MRLYHKKGTVAWIFDFCFWLHRQYWELVEGWEVKRGCWVILWSWCLSTNLPGDCPNGSSAEVKMWCLLNWLTSIQSPELTKKLTLIQPINEYHWTSRRAINSYQSCRPRPGVAARLTAGEVSCYRTWSKHFDPMANMVQFNFRLF